jgi:GGDEF domain-containing protein
VLFIAVGVAVLLVAVNTPLRLDEGIGVGGRAALYAISAFATAFALGIYVVARYGGEELVVLLPGTTPEGAAVFNKRARGNLPERSQKELEFPPLVSAEAVGSESGKSADEILDDGSI